MCIKCGNRFPNHSKSKRESVASTQKWYYDVKVVLILLLIVPPVGIFIIWKNPTVTEGWKSGLSAVFALYMVAIPFSIFLVPSLKQQQEVEVRSEMEADYGRFSEKIKKLNNQKPHTVAEGSKLLQEYEYLKQEVTQVVMKHKQQGIESNFEGLVYQLDNSLYAVNRQIESIKASHFDILSVDEEKIWSFIQGDWHGVDEWSEFTDYYKVSVRGKHITVRKYSYMDGLAQKYKDRDNAPYEVVIDCDFSGLTRRSVESQMDGAGRWSAQNEDRVYFDYGSTCENEKSIFFLKREQAEYADVEENNEVDFMAGFTSGISRVYFSRGTNFD
jgi:hypothetical protein